MPDRLPYPFARPLVPPPAAWAGLLDESYDARWFANGGPLVRRLEAALATDVAGGREVVTCASATSGLAAVLLALELRGPIAVPAFTFPATVAAIEQAGCWPVFCDIDPATLELDATDVSRAISDFDCVGVVHVRAFGFCHDLGPIEAVADAASIPLIIDAAAAFGGTTPDGHPVGRSGAAEVFSFHATKVFAIGEGGAVATTPELAQRIRHVANFAIDGADVTGRALNAKLPEISAAVALAMRADLRDHISVRRAAAATLHEALTERRDRQSATPDIVLPHLTAGAPPLQCLPLLFATTAERTAFAAALELDGIEARAYYCPGLHRATAWRGQPGASRQLPATDDVARRALCLPLYSDLQAADLRFFASACARASTIAAGVAAAAADTQPRAA
ncbi:MAG: DegT/DnrJ/EryC1/StrS family protein [Thermoleophilia bacterium]|nr:DegT/DnrJ/EryC1/StrS family protein [Thermoleophilia bacterium]